MIKRKRIAMKQKIQNNVSQSLHPIVGFGWFTGSRFQNRNRHMEYRSVKKELMNSLKQIKS